MSPYMTEVLASQDLLSKKYDELQARRIARTAKTAIAAIEQMQIDEAASASSHAALGHKRRHAARVEARADALRSCFKLVRN